MKHLMACLAAAVLVGCASSPATDTAYNQGVAAYRVKNYQEAAAQWSTAVEAGNIDAMNNLGYLLFYGLGTEARQQKAIALWREAAVKGQAESQWHLGNAYADGEGVEKNRVTAYAWYRCSVESAGRRFRESANATDREIGEDARKSLVGLTDQLSGDELEQGKALAMQYIASYAPVAQDGAPAR